MQRFKIPTLKSHGPFVSLASSNFNSNTSDTMSPNAVFEYAGDREEHGDENGDIKNIEVEEKEKAK